MLEIGIGQRWDHKNWYWGIDWIRMAMGPDLAEARAFHLMFGAVLDDGGGSARIAITRRGSR